MHWLSTNPYLSYITLHYFVLWGVRNKGLFEYKVMNVPILVERARLLFKECGINIKQLGARVLKVPNTNKYGVWGFFCGAFKGNLSSYGANAILCINQQSFIKPKIEVGIGTHFFVEVMMAMMMNMMAMMMVMMMAMITKGISC